MADYRKYESAPNLTFKGVVDPSESVVGAKKDDLWGNSVTGELFACEVETFGSQVWHGSQGTRVPVLIDPILLPTHPDLVAMYTMDNISGNTLIDETGNGNDGTVTGATAVDGQIGNALSFDGVDDFVDLGAGGFLPATGDWAVSVLVKLDSLAEDFDIFTQYIQDTGQPRSLLRYDSSPAGSFDLYLAGSSIISSSVTPLSGRYYAVVFQRCGEFAEISVDGGTLEQGVFASTTAILATGNLLGARTTTQVYNNMTGGVFWSSDMDQLRIFNRALTQQEITALYNEGAP